MKLEEAILDFDKYAKKNSVFNYYKKKVENFVREHPLEKLINYSEGQIYSKGESGKDSYLRLIGNEELMGTRVGQIYTGFPSFFNQPGAFETFQDFIKDLVLIDTSDFSNSFRTRVIKQKYFIKNKKFSKLKSIIIQMLSCYFPDYFLPIYNLNMLFEIIKNIEIDLDNLDNEVKEKINSNKIEDLSERILFSNELLFEKKRNHKIMNKWDNIVFTHFSFMCLPIRNLEAIKRLNIGMKYLDHTNEQFVVGIFSRVHEKLGFKYITRLKTSYPDAEVEDDQGNIKKIEFEFNSSSFKTHEELAELCDIIVCWHDDLNEQWKQKYADIEIISFEDILDSNSELYKKLYSSKSSS